VNPADTGKATPQNLMSEFTQLVQQFKLPGIDLTAVMESRRKDIEALATANRTALEGIQSLGQKQVEILRSTIDELQSLIKTATAKDPSSLAATGELVQAAIQRAFANMRELADVAYKSQSEAAAVVSRRVQENIEELKALVSPKK
jgi:phasin family protein